MTSLLQTRNGSFQSNSKETYQKIFDTWSFDLSDFQKWAIYSIHMGHDTLVCAPTGSGKTLPAEYAINHFTNMGKKIIYTTPVKALSNEKFYDLSKKFPNISFGLITGDNKFNPEADVVIMTTEILLNTLDKIQALKINSEKIQQNIANTLDFEMDLENELGCIVYDEIHYINDPDRGHVWEKCIMKMPKNVIFIGLSATINCPEKLCNWSSSALPFGAGRREINLCQTTHRNVPLEHYSFISMPDSNLKKMDNETTSLMKSMLNKPILLKKQNRPFEEKNYNKIRKILKYFTDTRININHTFIFNKVIDYLYNNNLLPGLAFVFSRKQCYVWASRINRSLFEEGSKTPSIIEKKATQILISKLSNWKEYVELPEFKNIIKLLQKGIAVHHSGVTPVFREMIELLYGEGNIRLLIATETFAIGINMGIKSCIFTSLTKFDGRGFRFLHSHEYGQAAGRSGRRGKDERGVIIHLNTIYNSRNNNPDANTYSNMLSGNPQTLISKFSIDFNLILSLLNIGTKNLSTFVNSSMLTNELDKEKKSLEKKIQTLIEKKTRLNEDLNRLSTKRDVLENYAELLQQQSFTTNKKKKKQITRNISNFSDEHKHLQKDFQKWKELKELEKLLKKHQLILNNIINYVDSEINQHLNILHDCNFIEQENKNEDYKTTIKGDVAVNIHEIHSLAMAEILIEGELNKLTVEELIAVLSIFTDIRLSDEDKYYSVSSCQVNDNIKKSVQSIKKKLNKYNDIETKFQTNFSQKYDIQYDMCEFMYQWCFAENNVDCRKIYDDAKSYNIYMGEFVKAVLKLVNISNELEKACAIMENIDLMNKLSKVKEKVLKSIATSQSLYL